MQKNTYYISKLKEINSVFKILFVIIFLLIISCQSQENTYITKEFSFNYPKNYELNETRYVNDVNVKLISKQKNDDNKYNNIGINFNSAYTSTNQINKKELFESLKKEFYLNTKKIGFNSSIIELISYEFTTIENKKVFILTTKSIFDENYSPFYQRIYLYINNSRSFFATFTSGSLKSLSENKNEIESIIKSVKIFKK